MNPDRDNRDQSSPRTSLILTVCHIINSLHVGKCFILLLLSADFFSKKLFRNTIRVSNGLEPDQDRHSVCPGLGQNCLQSLLADNKSCRLQGRVNSNL